MKKKVWSLIMLGESICINVQYVGTLVLTYGLTYRYYFFTIIFIFLMASTVKYDVSKIKKIWNIMQTKSITYLLITTRLVLKNSLGLVKYWECLLVFSVHSKRNATCTRRRAKVQRTPNTIAKRERVLYNLSNESQRFSWY